VHAHAGLVVEPAGVAGVAAILADRSSGREGAVRRGLTGEQIARWLSL
jgi:hypothetical protein